MCNVYRSFVSQLAKVAQPLNETLKEGSEPDWYNPSDIITESFEALEDSLAEPPTLPLPNRDKKYIIDT